MPFNLLKTLRVLSLLACTLLVACERYEDPLESDQAAQLRQTSRFDQ